MDIKEKCEILPISKIAQKLPYRVILKGGFEHDSLLQIN